MPVLTFAQADLETWMQLAIAQARCALELDEVPIGCVIVNLITGAVIGSGYNRRQIDRDPTAHAEILAIRSAGRALNDWRLIDCAIVVTLEPCPMCAGAIVNARIPHLVYGCADPKAGAVHSLLQLCNDSRLNHQVNAVGGVAQQACSDLLTGFFRAQRALGKK